MPKIFTWGQFLSPKTAKGTARVCQKHAGEFACEDPARPFVIHPACLWFADFVCPHVYCAVLPFFEAHGVTFFVGLLRRGIPQMFLPAPRCPLCRKCFKSPLNILFWHK
jgi:hypothetical protein